jgi:hypothetical protein
MKTPKHLLLENLAHSLIEKNPNLDLWGFDRKVLHIAFQDLQNYLKFHWNIISSDESEIKLQKRLLSYSEDPTELNEFIQIWSGLWLNKWNNRVKLVLAGRDLKRWKRTDHLMKKAIPIWRRLKKRNMIKNIIIESLIRSGEICGTSILAESMLKIEIGMSVEKSNSMEDHGQILGVINRVLRKARESSKGKGPLLYIRIGKRFFQLVKQDI